MTPIGVSVIGKCSKARLIPAAHAKPRSYSRTASSRTCAPAAHCAKVVDSASLWLMPFRQGTKIMVVGATRAMRAGDGQRLVRGLVAAATLGALFLAIQGYEWMRLIEYGLTVSSGAYGGTFYTLIGAHAAHVVGALVWLGVTLTLAARGRFLDGQTAVLRACAIYWHFVVALWPVLYVSVYLV